MRWIMYFGCMKNWWLCSSSLFWFQDETLQTSNVIGQGDIFYVLDKWSLYSFKYIKIFLCWCQFTIEVLWILHVYHKVLGGFVSSKIRLPTSDLYGFFSSHKKTNRFSLRNISVLSQAYQHLEALHWRGFTSSFNRSMCSMFNKHINFSIAYHSSYWGFVICITFHVMLN